MTTPTNPSLDEVDNGQQEVPRLEPRRLTERRRRRKGRAGAAVDSAAPVADIHGLEELYVIRESSMYKYALLDKMMEQILRRSAGVPEVDRMLAIGHKVMTGTVEGEQLRNELGARWLYAEGRTRAVALLIILGRRGFLIGLTSASRADMASSTDNAWVTVLAEQLAILRPKNLVTGPFSRLVRNQYFAGRLAVPIRQYGIRVHPAEAPSGFVLHEANGDLMWSMLAGAAHQDWLMTVTRLLTGTIFELVNGRLPHAPNILPLGYRFSSENGTPSNAVEYDPDQVDLVRDFICWAASDLSLAEIATRLGERGVRARGPHDGAQARLIHEVSYPESAVIRLLQHLPVYADGLFVYHHANPLPGITEFHGQLVHRDSVDEQGEFRFTLEFPVPPGGWCDPDILTAAVRRRLMSSTAKPATETSSDRKPLAGLPRWVEDGWEYLLDSHDETYTLRRRSADQAVNDRGQPAAWPHYSGQLMGRFRAGDLHRCVAGMLRDLAREAVTDVPCGEHADPLDVPALTAQAEEAERHAQAARSLAVAATSPQERQAYADQARTSAERASGIRARLHGQAARAELAHATAVIADAPRLLVLAELLERHDGRAPIAVNQAARQVIRDLRITAEPGQPQATVTLRATVQTSLGAITLGPASAPVRNTTMRPRPDGQHPRVDRDRALAAAVAADSPHDREVLEAEGLSPRSQRRRAYPVVASLLPTPAAASAILDCPIPAVRAAVLADLMPGIDPGAAAELDPGFVTELRAVYLDPAFPTRTKTWARGDLTEQRIAMDWVARNGTVGVRVDQLRAATGLGEPTLYALLSTDPARYRTVRAGDAHLLEPTTPWPRRQPLPPHERLVRPRPCPHCGATSWALNRVPELPDGAVCRQCLRAPSAPYTFPSDYLRPWAGPLQGKRRLKETGDRAPLGTHEKPYHVPPRRRAS